jgi:hypothetical protein
MKLKQVIEDAFMWTILILFFGGWALIYYVALFK